MPARLKSISHVYSKNPVDSLPKRATVSSVFIPTKQTKSSSPKSEIHKKNKQSVATFFGKTIKESLSSESLDIIESYASVKLTTALRKSFDGDKKLSAKDKKTELEQFDFNSNNKFDDTVNAKVFVKSGSHKGYAILHIPSFVPINDLRVPEEATNFKFCATLVSLSDFKRTGDANTFIPENDEVHGLTGKFETTMLPVLRMQTQPITTQVRLNRTKPLEKGVSSVLILAVKFYSYKKGKFQHLAKESSMKIMKVF